MRLKRETFRHIEAEIRAYHGTLQAMEELRRQIILGGVSEPMKLASGQGYVTSAVERRATVLADSILLREMERITHAIRETYEVAREECRLVVWARYGLALDWRPPEEMVEALGEADRFTLSIGELAPLVGMSEPTFYRARSWFIHQVAERLGWY